MKCAKCKVEADGVCRFCGAGTCASHCQPARFVVGWRSTGQGGWGRFPRTDEDYVVVQDARWCGACRVEVHQT